MRRKTTLRELFSFKPKKGPGFEIEPAFYLHVLAAKMPLPSIREVVEPKGENDAVIGFGVPLSGGKETLDLPMERGTYAIASLDRKTMLRAMVMSKEEVGLNVDLVAQHFELEPEAQARLLSTWMVIQLSFESFDPEVHPATRFALAVARRMGELTAGIVADPSAQLYRMPESLLVSGDPYRSIDVCRFAFDSGVVQSQGMVKFGLPELELRSVSDRNVPVAQNLLANMTDRMLRGDRILPGSTYAVSGAGVTFQVAWAGTEGQKLELIPDGVEQMDELLDRL